jgi:hypothetical protein
LDRVKPRLRKKYSPRNTSFFVVDVLYSRGCAGGGCAGVTNCASTSSSSLFKGASLETDVRSKLYFSPSCDDRSTLCRNEVLCEAIWFLRYILGSLRGIGWYFVEDVAEPDQ